MVGTLEPKQYDAWYHTARGAWIADQEYALLTSYMQTCDETTLLDVGCGTGYFSRLLEQSGFNVTGLDPEAAVLAFADSQDTVIPYIKGIATELPFSDNTFEYVTAITSLCFIRQPAKALKEMWRVARQGVFLGILNQHSLLYVLKYNCGAYQGARWDSWQQVRNWLDTLRPKPAAVYHQNAVLLPSGSGVARKTEKIFARWIPWGGFLAIYLKKLASSDCL